jgi:spore germination protein KB
MVFPRCVNDLSKSKKALLRSQLWSGAMTFLTIFLTILVLGYAITSKSSYPTLLLSTQINMGIVITRMEYIISGIWMLTQFMIGLFFFLSAVMSLSEVADLKDHKRIILPMGLVVLILSGIVFPNSVYQMTWDNLVYAPLITTFGFIIPFLMMIVSMIKGKFSASDGRECSLQDEETGL